MFCLLLPAERVPAQSHGLAIKGDRLSGFVLPNQPVHGDIEIEALRSWKWTVDDTQRIVCEGDVIIRIAAQAFTCPRAVIWLNRIPSAEGQINQVAVFFDALEDGGRRRSLVARGEKILITGSCRGRILLHSVRIRNEEPPRGSLLRDAEQALADILRGYQEEMPSLALRPTLHVFEGDDLPLPPGTVLPGTPTGPRMASRPPWLRLPEGRINFFAREMELLPGEEENVIIADGSIVIDYYDDSINAEISQLTLSAQRAVIFTDPGPVTEFSRQDLDADMIRGIYMEGAVQVSTNDGMYRIRAPRLFYDFRQDSALMLEAVLRTYRRDHRFPIYARASEMRQLAQNQWEGRNVSVSSTAFRRGHLALGAARMTITQRPHSVLRPDEDEKTTIEARDIRVNRGTLPLFRWPFFSGTIDDIPLRRLHAGRENRIDYIGGQWDLFSLLQFGRSDVVQSDVGLDLYGDRGTGGGLDLTYALGDNRGALDLYLMNVDGPDRTSAGKTLDPSTDLRGHLLFSQHGMLNDNWSLDLQVSKFSDPSYMTTWEETLFRNRREFENSIFAAYRKNHTAFTVLGTYAPDDFLSNSWLLASTGYAVDRLPELAWREIGASILGGRGLYFSETGLSRMRFAFEESTPAELGIPGAAWGIPDTTPVSDSLIAMGFPLESVTRFDSRHEVTAPFQGGPVRITPYVVGRITAYDTNFASFGTAHDDTRTWFSGGVRTSLGLQRIYDDVENRLFDLHRLRHLMEPFLTLQHASSSTIDDAFPIYDPDVEDIGSGGLVHLGIRNTWQTQRGGPGQWQSDDVLSLNTSIVLFEESGQEIAGAPIFYEYRPELGTIRDHARSEFLWKVTDAVTVAGKTTWDIDRSHISIGSAGAEVEQSPDLRTFIEYRFIRLSNNELIGTGWNYRLTPKYHLSIGPQWDLEEDTIRAYRVQVMRIFPDFRFYLQVHQDEIRDELSLSGTIRLAEF